MGPMPCNLLQYPVLLMSVVRSGVAATTVFAAALSMGCGDLSGIGEWQGSSRGALLASQSSEPTPSKVLEQAAYARVQQSLARSPENLRILTRPDGLHDVQVVSGFQHMTLLVRQSDGTLATHCTSDADEAARLLAAGAK